jgi:hypothetical protein
MEMKRLLIISPYFPPCNAPDMQRVRTSLSYYEGLGWETEVVSVYPTCSNIIQDDLLSKSIPDETIIHFVKALPLYWTSKLGLGSIALRSLWFYRQKVNDLLKRKKYDLVFFSTTQFPVCILGAYWKRRFGVPYVIDMQDPWHSDYYRYKPGNQRPPKYWFSYRLNKWMEPLAMKQVSGLISVSQAYIDDLRTRYPAIKNIPGAVITLGVFEKDFAIAKNARGNVLTTIKDEPGKVNMVYVGRGGQDMHQAVRVVFLALQQGLRLQPQLFKRFKVYFIGTSYASAGHGSKTIQPLADQMGLNAYVIEMTDRIGFYDTLATLKKADILFIPGSDDAKYTASKLYYYMQSMKPLLSIFQKTSSAVKILRSCSPESKVFTLPAKEEQLVTAIYLQMSTWVSSPLKPLALDELAMKEYSALDLTIKQTALFDDVISS